MLLFNRFLFLSILLILRLPSIAQDVVIDPLQESKPTTLKIKPAVLPIVYYSPETHFAVGVTGLLLFKTEEQTTRTSFINFLGMFTQRKQRILGTFWSVFTPKEKFFIKGEIYFSKFPDYFYGVGNQTPNEAKESIRYKTFLINNWCLKQIKPHLFFGPQYQFYKVFDIHFPYKSHFNQYNLKSINGSVSSGLGLALVYDSRDHTTNAHTGWYIETSGFNYAQWIGSHYNFTSFLIDVRKYIPLSKKSTLAIALSNNFNIGDVPFKQLAYLGGTRNMRGYYEGRYRDKNSVILQMEYRQNVYKRWGLAVFGSIGNVYSNFRNLTQSNLKYTVGGGLRFTINKKENTNIRFDEGFGAKTRGAYGNFGEAF